MRRMLAVLVALILWAGTAWATPGEKRVALVIGNAAYDHVSRLPNTSNDATDMAATLERLGFSVTLVRDLGWAAMREALAGFSDAATGAEVGVVFYAGHGIELDRQNYLIPVDARLETDRRVRFETVPLDLVMEALAGVTGLRMVLLDACRNNPFAAKMTMTTATRSVSRGLARVEPAVGTLVGFAAKEGTTADDGTGRNSPYTAALLAHLAEPGLDVQFMFRRIRDAVLAATGGRQEPFTYGSLPGHEVYLAPPAPTAAAPGPDAGTSTGPSGPSEAVEITYWNSVKDSGSVELLNSYLEEFPDGAFAGLARALIAALVRVEEHPSSSKEMVVPRQRPEEPPPDTDTPAVVAAVPPAPAPHDGLWRIHRLASKCPIGDGFFPIKVEDGTARWKFGSGTVDPDGTVRLAGKKGRGTAHFEGKVSGESGKGRFVGIAPNGKRCRGHFTMTRITR